MKKIIISLTLIVSTILLVGCSKPEGTTTNSTPNNTPVVADDGIVSVNLIPGADKAAVSELVNIAVNLNTGPAAVNSLKLVLNYPKDLLSFDSVSTSDTNFTMWMEKEGKDGTVTLVAGEPNPGVQNNEAKVAMISFKALKEGTAKVSLSTIDSSTYTSEETNRIKKSGHQDASVEIIAKQ